MSIQHRKAEVGWDGEIRYVVEGRTVGRAGYRLVDSELLRLTSQLFVNEDFRRQGIGKLILVELLSSFSGCIVDAGDLTEDGRRMLRSLAGEQGDAILNRFRDLDLR
jgi:hypothetical protein